MVASSILRERDAVKLKAAYMSVSVECEEAYWKVERGRGTAREVYAMVGRDCSL